MQNRPEIKPLSQRRREEQVERKRKSLEEPVQPQKRRKTHGRKYKIFLKTDSVVGFVLTIKIREKFWFNNFRGHI